MQPNVIDPQIPLLKDDRLRREAWIDVCSPVWTSTLDRTEPIPDSVRFRGWNTGQAVFYAMHASPQMVERTKTHVSSIAVDHIYLQMHYAGQSAVDADVGETPVGRGDLFLVDLAQRVVVKSPTGISGVSVCIPRRFFDARVGELGDLNRTVLSRRGNPLYRLLSEHLRNAQHCLDVSDEAQKAMLATATIALCNAALTPATDSAYNGPGVLKIEIRQFIEANLGRFDLDVGSLCARFGLSRTPIYVMFETEGGVMTYIRNRRLARAMRMLSGLEGSGPQRVSSVAHACGYANLQSFSKAFRARYGLNPRDVDGSLSFRTAAHLEAGATNTAWIKEL